MIVTKTPLRMSFFGGGSDIPSFYEKSPIPGLCISTTIDKYINIAVNRCATHHVRVIYSQMEVVKHVDDLKHDRAREALKQLGISKKVEICSFSDVPTTGTGLGSSSSFTVGLLHALNVHLTPEQTAELACHVEINRCGYALGKQDQYAAAIGGLHAYEFY